MTEENKSSSQIPMPVAPEALPAKPELKEIEAPKNNWGKRIAYGLIGILLFLVIVQIVVADKYEAQVLVIEGEKKVGVNPTAERLDFGDLSADTSATRFVTLNAGGMDTFITVVKFGKIAELIKLSENNFTVKEGDEKRLEFSLYMPPSAPAGEKYTGRVWIFKIPKIW